MQREPGRFGPDGDDSPPPPPSAGQVGVVSPRREDPGAGRRERGSRGRGKKGPPLPPQNNGAPGPLAGGPRPPKGPPLPKGRTSGGRGGPPPQKTEHRKVRRVRPVGREEAEIQHRRADVPFKRHAETWWADRWLNVLHRFGWKGRLANGRLYADESRVVSFGLETGRLKARVQGSRAEPYDVTIAIKPLPDADWDLVVEIMSCQALFTAQLLAGEMPQDVEEAFDAAQAPLFPRYKEDLTAHCNCPDWANPCKHIAAVYYVMADAFDKDPFLIFHLRGRSRETMIGMLRAQRAAEAQAMPMSVETLDVGSLEPFRFWQAGEEFDGVHISIQPPPLPGAIAKRLGRPPFWRSPADPVTRLPDVYEAVARRAREVALND